MSKTKLLLIQGHSWSFYNCLWCDSNYVHWS